MLVKLVRKLARLIAVVGLGFANAGAGLAQDADPRILAIGDSLMAWHSIAGKAIPDIVASELNEPTENRSLGGARMIFKVPIIGGAGMEIPQQIVEGDWDWVVMNGGGNDLWFGCGCRACEKKLDSLITDKGDSGEIPRVISELRETGANILFFGYLRSPGVDSMIEECRDEGDELERRIADYANATKNVYFLSNKDLVPDGDLSYHGFDRIHPSLKGSEEIGKRIAALIRKHDSAR